MVTKTSTVRARIEPKLKAETEHILGELGINTTEAIRIFFKQIKLQGGLPFELKIPNETTAKAMLEAYSHKNLSTFENTEELFEDLDI